MEEFRINDFFLARDNMFARYYFVKSVQRTSQCFLNNIKNLKILKLSRFAFEFDHYTEFDYRVSITTW